MQAEKISVTLTPDMLRTLRDSVEAGEYASTSEALRDAVRVWERQRLEDSERLAVIRARLKRSASDPRPRLSAEEAVAAMERFFDQAEKEDGSEAA